MARRLALDLRTLAQKALLEADNAPDAELAAAYESLRDSAAQLNLAQQWATPEEFATMFPDPDGLDEIAALNSRLSSPSELAPPPAGTRQCLRNLAGWAQGVAMGLDELDDLR